MRKVATVLVAGVCLTTLVHGQSVSVRHGVEFANARVGVQPTVIAKGSCLSVLAKGSDALENASGVITKFGYLNDYPVPRTIEPTKTEPDENTYLVLDHNPGGPTAGYDYGRRFLFQGHENSGNLAYITRINLDVTDPAHRITLLTPIDSTTGLTGFNSIDGSTYNPFSRTLLFTQERGSTGGVIQASVDWPSNAQTLDGIMGRGGFEGVHPDNEGNVILIEDAGGVGVSNDPANAAGTTKTAKQPNSFVYKFVPYDRADLTEGGTLYALQVSINGTPVTFHAADPFGDTYSTAQKQLHTMGTTWPVRWVKVHDNNTDGAAAFDANLAAKAAGATPFKRPENAQFLPGSNFRTLFFDPTGDTDATAASVPELAERGAWGSIFRLDIAPDAPQGTISIFYLGDAEHAAFDNLAFANERTLLAAEDRGDNLHRQLNRLDSIWSFQVSDANPNPRRFVALGRDPESATDANFLDVKTPGFQNDGDNEPTGLQVSDGSTSPRDLVGYARALEHARAFFTQQHGMNQVYEVTRCEDNAQNDER